MTNFLDILYTYLYKWSFLSFLLGLIGVFLYIKTKNLQLNNLSNKLKNILLIQFVITFIFLIFISKVLENRIISHYKDFLYRKKSVLKIENRIITENQKAKLINELKKIEKINGHGTHPIDKINIIIETEIDTLNLLIYKDSEIKNEYWIFCKDFNYSNEIGRIKTDLFKKL